ncbi:regulator of nonsense transcripts 1-like [Drosophila tropicalis]|uniref:regulator of nonsense transcripts 1-like n=1 Tax=Drosophila tropicalis TaxID=46794 RepID=UPI0035AB92D6
MLTEQLQSEKTLQMYLETKFQKISLQQRQWSSYFSQPSPVMQEQATPSTVDSSHHIPYHYHQQQQQPQPIWQSNLEQTNLEEQTSGHFTTDWPSIRVAPVAAKNRHTNQIWNVPLPHYQPEARPQPGVRAQPPTCTGINTVKPNTLSVGNGLLFMRNALFKSMANYDVPGAGLNQGYGVGLNDWNYNRSPLEGQQQQQQYQYYLQQQQMFQQQQQQLIQQQIQHRHYLQMQQYRHQQQQQQQLYQQQQQQEQHYRDMYNYNNNNNHHSDFQSNLESNYIEPTSSGHSSNQNSNLNQTINENQIMCNNSNNGTEVPENIRGILRLHSLEMDF